MPNLNCPNGYTSIEDINKNFDLDRCGSCPNSIFKDGIATCKLLEEGVTNDNR